MEGSEHGLIRQYITDRVHGVHVQDDEDLFANGHVNSLFAVQLVMWLQQTFNIRIQRGDLDLENYQSVQAIVRFVQTKRAADGVAPAAAPGGPGWTSD